MCPVARCRRGLRRDLSGSALPKFPQSVSRGAHLSRLHWFAFATACQVARPPGRIGPSSPGPRGIFTPRLPGGRSPFPPLDMTTTATGLLCWRDFHPQEWQLASLHQILGEMLTLIEDGKRRREEALRLAYPRTLDERVYVPDNLHSIGTMNLADRSLALVDLALRRRFAFITLAPLLNEAWRAWMQDRGCPPALLGAIVQRLDALNAVIAAD